MIDIRFTRDSRGRLSSVFARGHAEFGKYDEDVVCAAVSAVLQAAYAGLEDVAKLQFEGKHEAGELDIRIPEEARDRLDVSAILATAEVALVQIGIQYPAYVKVTRDVETKR